MYLPFNNTGIYSKIYACEDKHEYTYFYVYIYIYT
jgi:hypothetical protein